MNSKSKLLIGIAILAITISAAYFLYFIRTPIYAANQIREAIKMHDTVKFQRYVDINSVMNSAFEDIIKAESKINDDKIFSNPFALGILHMLKPTVVDLLSKEALAKVAANEIPQEQNEAPVPEAIRKNMERHLSFGKFELKRLQLASEDDRTAVITLVLYNTELEQEFHADIEMQLNKADDWQAKRIKNLDDLIIQMDEIRKARIEIKNEKEIEIPSATTK